MASATFPGRNGLIAFQAQTDSGVQIFTMRSNGHELRQTRSTSPPSVRPDGSDLRYLTHYQDGERANVGGYSPGGQWIIFRLQAGGTFALYRMRPDGSDLNRITPLSTTFVPRFIDWGPAASQ